METDFCEDLNKAGTKKEEVSFYNKGQENGRMYEFYNNYLSHISDIFAHLDGMCGEDTEIDDLRDELGWEAVAQISGGHREDSAQITAERKDASTLGLDWVTIARTTSLQQGNL